MLRMMDGRAALGWGISERAGYAGRWVMIGCHCHLSILALCL